MNEVIGYDAIHLNVSMIPRFAPVVLGYDTGTPDIRWTASDWAMFPHARHVHIDQGGPGSPVVTATVRDVETGAWDPQTAVGRRGDWLTERPTIYCNQNTLPRVLEAGWKGDLWLAKMESPYPVTPPVVAGCTVVAQQVEFDTAFDRNVVFDPCWPARRPSMTGITFAAPNNLHETATTYVAWQPVAPVGGKAPADYTVVAYGLDGNEYFNWVTPDTFCVITGLVRGWTYEVRVWANGGDNPPPHASLMIHT